MSELTLLNDSHAASSRVSAEARWSRRTGFGARLRHARTAAGMSLEDLACDLTSIAYLSRLEAGERYPSPALAAALAERLDPALDLISSEDRTSAGLAAELAHADLLLGTNQIEDATWVSAELVEVASAIGQREIAHAARIVHAYALAATGNHGTAVRTVRPLSHGPLAASALVAQARFHLDLGQHHRALEAGRRAADQMTTNGRASFSETAALAVTVCDSYEELGRHGLASHSAYLALRDLPTPTELGPAAASSSPGHLSLRSRSQSVAVIEGAVAELQMTQLCADINLLRAYGSPRTDSAALSTFDLGHLAVS